MSKRREKESPISVNFLFTSFLQKIIKLSKSGLRNWLSTKKKNGA